MNSNKVYEIVTDRVIKAINEKQELPWSKPWIGLDIPAQNFKSKRPYNGFNQMLTRFLNPSKPYHLTFKQAFELGGKIKKGSRSIPIIYWKITMFDKNNKVTESRENAERQSFLLRYYNVFNQEDIEGIAFPEPKIIAFDGNERIKKCEELITKNAPNLVNNDLTAAYYRPSTDTINMPELKQFKSSEFYYSTLFHELSHWTGHKDRLNRGLEIPKPFGTTDYSFEELIAELSASFVCNHLQIENAQTQHNSEAYLKGWLRAFRNDTSMIIKASSKAQKAFEYITE